MNLHVGHWVSVKDELPDNNRRVLIAIGFKIDGEQRLRYVEEIAWRYTKIDHKTQEERLTTIWETHDCDDCSWTGVKIIDDGEVCYWTDFPPMKFE